MAHWSATGIVRLVAGELGDAERNAASAHLEGCEMCRARVAAQRRVWAALGAREAAPASRDLCARVLERLGSGKRRKLRLGTVSRVARVAAAVALGLTGGYVAARYGQALEASGSGAALPEVHEAPLELLTNPSPAGLYAAVAELGAEPVAEEQP